MLPQLFRKKTIQASLEEIEQNGTTLKRVLTVRDLTLFGIASVVGAGIFSTIGQAAFEGGPSIILLFILTALSCGLASLCYAEFSARVPVAGSAYTYAYVAFGELVAWVIACCLVLEYAVSNMVVAVSWSAYFNNLLQGLGFSLPEWLLHSPFDKDIEPIAASAPSVFGIPIIANLPTVFIVIPITWLCYVGMNQTKNSSNLMVYLKLLIMFVVIVAGTFYIDPDNWDPFFPNGRKGMFAGVSSVFFAYIGFDAISTTAEECKNPQRDLPRSIIYSLIICTIIYILIALVLTGAVHYSKLEGVADPIAYLFEHVNNHYMVYIISVSTLIATTTALIVYQLGQPRVWMMMSRDGLLPNKFSTIHKKYRTPSFGTIIAGISVGIGGLFLPLELITDITSIGTLFAFAVVCFGILFLPKGEVLPDAKPRIRSFKVPYVNGRYIMPVLFVLFIVFNVESIYNAFSFVRGDDWLQVLFLLIFGAVTIAAVIKSLSTIPLLGGLSSLYLMVEIPANSWVIFGYWMLAGLIFYTVYGYKRSKMRKPS